MSGDRCPCGGIILADTEDWSRPLCHACWQDIGEPDVEPFNKYSELKEFWVLKENVKNGDVPAGPEKPDYSELFYHTVEKSAYSYAVDQWDYWVEEARKAQAKHERVLQTLEIAKATLEFYANRSAWVKKQNNLDPTFCRSDNEYDKSLGFYFGGKTAREALAKIKESK